MAAVFVFGGNSASRQAIKACPERAGYAVSVAAEGQEGSPATGANDIVIAAASKASGIPLLRRLRVALPGAGLIAVGYEGRAATREGADYCLPGQLDCEALRLLVITLDDLPPRGVSLEAVERTLTLKALEKCNWNQSQAVRYLDLSRKTLIYRMEEFGLRKAPRGPDDGTGGVRARPLAPETLGTLPKRGFQTEASSKY